MRNIYTGSSHSVRLSKMYMYMYYKEKGKNNEREKDKGRILIINEEHLEQTICVTVILSSVL